MRIINTEGGEIVKNYFEIFFYYNGVYIINKGGKDELLINIFCNIFKFQECKDNADFFKKAHTILHKAKKKNSNIFNDFSIKEMVKKNINRSFSNTNLPFYNNNNNNTKNANNINNSWVYRSHVFQAFKGGNLKLDKPVDTNAQIGTRSNIYRRFSSFKVNGSNNPVSNSFNLSNGDIENLKKNKSVSKLPEFVENKDLKNLSEKERDSNKEIDIEYIEEDIKKADKENFLSENEIVIEIVDTKLKQSNEVVKSLFSNCNIEEDSNNSKSVQSKQAIAESYKFSNDNYNSFLHKEDIHLNKINEEDDSYFKYSNKSTSSSNSDDDLNDLNNADVDVEINSFSTDDLVYFIFILSIDRLEELAHDIKKEAKTLQGIYISLGNEIKEFYRRLDRLESEISDIYSSIDNKTNFFYKSKKFFIAFNNSSENVFFKDDFNFSMDLMLGRVISLGLKFKQLREIVRLIKENFSIIIEASENEKSGILNSTFKALTIIATFFYVFGFIPVLFGMNLKIPFKELDNYWPFFVVILITLGMTFAQLIFCL